MSDLNATADSSKLDKVIARVQKLMNLADTSKNPNEEEAASAARMAQDLMAKYNLDMATIEANGDVTTTSAQGGKREKTKMEGRAMYRWQRELMAEVAKANFCYHWVSYRWQAPQQKWSETPKEGFEYSWGETGPNGEQYVKQGKWTKIPYHVLVGREVNVLSARLMFDYLCQTIERLVPIENNAQRLSKWAMSWKEGCSDRVITRLMDRRIAQEREQAQAAQQAQASGGTALVLLTDYSQAEREANYELAYGYEPGTLAKQRQEWADGAEQRRVEAERAAQELAEQLANMTPKERERYERELAKEQEKARKEQERWEQRERTRRQQEAQRLDWSAYRSGQRAGDSVGLDTQVEGGRSSSRGSLEG